MSNLPRNQRARVEIDCAALRHNLKQVKKRTPNAAVMAVVKANAYGHGMQVVVDALDSELDEADEFAVSSLDGAERLRSGGVKRPINTFSAQFSSDDIAEFGAGVKLTIFDHTQLEALKKTPPRSPINVWLKIDTGMGRLGFLSEEAPHVLSELRRCSANSSIGLMTHLANGDDPSSTANSEQIELVKALLNEHTFDAVSVLNSGGICCLAQAGDWRLPEWVRPGLMLYGASPLLNQTAQQLGLVPAMKFSAPLISVRRLPAGAKIGYGGTAILEKASSVGVVACGYGDGYPRHAQNGTPVFINGKHCPLLGRVSMDMISIDLSGVQADVGDEAVLWGSENPIEQVATNSMTIPYTLMCGVSERVERLVKNG